MDGSKRGKVAENTEELRADEPGNASNWGGWNFSEALSKTHPFRIGSKSKVS